jgi:hypothetical protein
MLPAALLLISGFLAVNLFLYKKVNVLLRGKAMDIETGQHEGSQWRLE